MRKPATMLINIANGKPFLFRTFVLISSYEITSNFSLPAVGFGICRRKNRFSVRIAHIPVRYAVYAGGTYADTRAAGAEG